MSWAARVATFSQGLDPATSALITAMTVKPTAQRTSQLNTLVRALKSAGTWAKRDAIWVTASHDSQAARLNLKAPGTNTLSEVNAPTFTTDRGYTGDAVSAYLETGYVPTGTFLLDTHNAAIYINSADAVAATTELGMSTQRIQVRGSTTNIITRSSSGTSKTGPASIVANGRTSYNRSDSSGYVHRKNGADVDTIVQVSSTVGTVSFQILALNSAGTPANFSARRVAYAALGGSLTSAEDLAEHNALLTFLTAIGAQ